MPFVDYYQGDYWNSFDQGVKKLLLFLPLGVLLTLALPPALQRRGWGVVVLLAAGMAAAIEAGQLFLPTRYASITDILVESCGAWIGVVIARHTSFLLQGTPEGSRDALRRRPIRGTDVPFFWSWEEGRD